MRLDDLGVGGYGACTRAPGSDRRDDSLVSGPPMSRRSLRPQLNQIRGWVRQGRTDAWIAHQLEVTVQQIHSLRARGVRLFQAVAAGVDLINAFLRSAGIL